MSFAHIIDETIQKMVEITQTEDFLNETKHLSEEEFKKRVFKAKLAGRNLNLSMLRMHRNEVSFE